jgi:hypothetical protein
MGPYIAAPTISRKSSLASKDNCDDDDDDDDDNGDDDYLY